MAVTIDIRALGVEETLVALNSLTPRLRNAALKQSVSEGTRMALDHIRKITPVRTGALASGLFATLAKPKSNKRTKGYNLGPLVGRVLTPPRAHLDIRPWDPYYYPSAVEFGYTDQLGRQVLPKSFMRRGLEEVGERIRANFRVNVTRALQVLAASSSRRAARAIGTLEAQGDR